MEARAKEAMRPIYEMAESSGVSPLRRQELPVGYHLGKLDQRKFDIMAPVVSYRAPLQSNGARNTYPQAVSTSIAPSIVSLSTM